MNGIARGRDPFWGVQSPGSKIHGLKDLDGDRYEISDANATSGASFKMWCLADLDGGQVADRTGGVEDTVPQLILGPCVDSLS